MIRILLFANPAGVELKGWVEFSRLLFVEQAGNCTCSPFGVLTLEELKDLADQLRRLPQVNSGTVGKYHWREA